MRTVYRKNVLGELTITEASTLASFYGVCCNFTLATYSTPQYVGVRFEFHPAYKEGANIPGCGFSNFIRIHEGMGGHRRSVDQEIILKDLIVEVLPLQSVANADEGLGREICQSILRYFGGVAEQVRKDMLASFSSYIREKAAQDLDARYSKYAENTIRKLLSTLNWPLLLESLNVPDQVKQIVDFTLTHNFPAFYALSSDGDKDAIDVNPDGEKVLGIDATIARIERELENERDAIRWAELERERAAAEIERQKQQRIADLKAQELLKLVCGPAKFTEYLEKGRISVENEGWMFVLRPRNWVECTDPDGNTANLCIHTVNLSCNALDEMVLAYLHIKHKMADYLRVAIPHCSSPGFSLAKFKKSEPKKK